MLRDLDVGSTWSNMLLLGGLEHEWIMTFHSVGNGIIIPTDFHIFQGWVETTRSRARQAPGVFIAFLHQNVSFQLF